MVKNFFGERLSQDWNSHTAFLAKVYNTLERYQISF